MTYTHRNGDTAAPTLRGNYFFRGTCLRWWSASNKRSVNVAGIVYVDEFGQPDPFNESHSGDWDGQWWGPVQAPWEAQ